MGAIKENMNLIKDKVLERYFEPVEDEEVIVETAHMIEDKREVKQNKNNASKEVYKQPVEVENVVAVVLKPTIISKGTEIHGRFVAENDLEIRGNIIGDVKTTGNLIVDGGSVTGNIHAKSIVLKEAQVNGHLISEEFISVHLNSYVEGDIHGKEVSIDGECKGNIIAEESLYLMTHAKSKGNITTFRFKVDENALLDGEVKIKKNNL